ncbi:MAG: hypothetical protein JKY65_06360, partial [Planctomycetes bacterium]|nr:hypothetical protein [Planctomycetota bacterium]
MVEVGGRVGGYTLEAELGRGVLGRSFKARRGSKGKKRYVLKVLDRSDYAYLLNTRYGQSRVNVDDLPSVRGFKKAWIEGDSGYVLVGKHYERTLADLIGNGPLRAGQARRLILEAAQVLSQVHAAGRHHGGLAPGNLLLGPKGVLLSDFGLWLMARRLGPETLDAYQESRGTTYRPPEDPTGTSPSKAGDVYALGAILREALGSSPPAVLEPVVAKATAVDVKDRYASAKEFALALEGAAFVEPSLEPSEPVETAASPPPSAVSAPEPVPESAPAVVEEFDPLASDPSLAAVADAAPAAVEEFDPLASDPDLAVADAASAPPPPPAA